MEIALRPISHSHDEIAMGHCIFYPPIDVDAMSCTYNMDGHTSMAAVVRALGFDRKYFANNRNLEKWHQEAFRVQGHKNFQPLLITTSKTRTWNDAPQATSEIIKVANAEGCKSLCLTHFMFLPGEFPKSAFKYCLQMAANSKKDGQLFRIIVDVDERHMEKATGLLREVHAQLAYAQRLNLLDTSDVGCAEAGSSDYQGWLAAKILCRSDQDDRFVEALKWLIIASITNWKVDTTLGKFGHKPAFEFLVHGMETQQVDEAFEEAKTWLEEKCCDPIRLAECVPEFRNSLESH